MDLCPCGSKLPYMECCAPRISGARPAATAEQLMRSRYSAYVKHELDYLFSSLHPNHRADYDEKSSRAWAERAQWHGIEILNTIDGGPDDLRGEVEFTVSFTEGGVRQEHHELSSFQKEEGQWFFTTGKILPARQVIRATPKTGRNDPCHCGSGKKFKKCCGH